jgi:tRNA A-37 threonylcarbamoyl transferase component Bud32
VDSTIQHFVYHSHLNQDESKLIFLAKPLQGGGPDLVVKFVRQYSEEVHKYCAKEKAAPELLGFKSMPGGWYMVVMALIEGFDLLHQSPSPIPMGQIKKIVKQLHERGYVHGDIWDTNVMVSPNGDAILLDFDWAGEIGKAQYPMNVHYGDDLYRPEGARDGMFITCQHDIKMMEVMFEVAVEREKERVRRITDISRR